MKPWEEMQEEVTDYERPRIEGLTAFLVVVQPDLGVVVVKDTPLPEHVTVGRFATNLDLEHAARQILKSCT